MIILCLALFFGLLRLLREGLDCRRDRELERLAGDPRGEAGHLRVHGNVRRYYLHFPRALPVGPVPLVIAFHGGRGNAVRFARQTSFNAVADRGSFAVVYPEAVGMWNDGRPESASGVDDVAFVRALIRHLVETKDIDPARIYATGASNGGMFTLRLACELASEITAFASVMAAMPVLLRECCRPARKVPLMMINGTEDPFIPWEGGEIGPGRQVVGGEVLSVHETVDFWIRHNGCWSAAKRIELAPAVLDDDTRVDILRYPAAGAGLHAGADVILVRIRGSGHAWPGSQIPMGSRRENIVGRTSRQIDASELIWDFFNNYPPALGSSPLATRPDIEAPPPIA